MFGKTDTNFKFNLGDEVEDILTGFSGVIVNRSQWIHNCNTYGLQSKKLKDEKPVSKEWFDEPQLKLIEKEKVIPNNRTGGPCCVVPVTNR